MSYQRSSTFSTPAWMLGYTCLLTMGGAAHAVETTVKPGAELVPDPAWVTGQCTNGVRWVWRQHNNPAGRVAFRLHVRAGSLQESAQQRGLAHYLEHMAFNGTTNFPPEAMVSRLQSIGVGFGSHNNAHTSFDETVYKLEMPDNEPAKLDLALQILSETASGMLLLDSEIERERGIIQSEMRDRDGAGIRVAKAMYGVAYAGSLIAERFPIGTPETLAAADRNLIKSYYDGFYRCDRFVVSVVGAVDTSITERINRWFAPLSNQPSQIDPPLPAITPGVVTAIIPEAEADGLDLHLVRARSAPLPADGPALRQENLLVGLAMRIINRRFAALVEADPHGPILGASAQHSHRFGISGVWISAQVRPVNATAAVSTLDKVVRGMRLFGPTASELALEMKALRGELDQAVTQAGSRTSAALAEGASREVALQRVLTGPEVDRTRILAQLPLITPGHVKEALSSRWESGQRESLILAGRGAQAYSEKDLQIVWAAATKAVLAPSAERDGAQWAYPAPNAATFAFRTLAAQVLRTDLDNQVVVQVRPSASQPGTVLCQVRLGHGHDQRPAGVSEYFSRAFIDGGLGKHDQRALREIVAGTSLRGPFASAVEDGTHLSITCQQKDLELACRMLAAFVSDPGWRDQGAITSKSSWIDALIAGESELSEVVGRALSTHLLDNNPSRRAANLQEVNALTWDKVRSWYAPHLAQAPMTVLVAGDVKPEDAQIVAQVFAGLAPRKPVPLQSLDTKQSWLMPAPPWTPTMLRVSATAQTPAAVVRLLWPTGDMYDIVRFRRLALLSACLGERMRVRIREQLALGYSPGASRWASDTFAGYGYVSAEITPTIERLDEAERELRALALTLADNLTPELLQQVRVPVLRGLQATYAQQSWWLNTILSRSGSQPYRLDWSSSLEQDLASVTVADLQALAKEVFIDSRVVGIRGIARPAP